MLTQGLEVNDAVYKVQTIVNTDAIVLILWPTCHSRDHDQTPLCKGEEVGV